MRFRQDQFFAEPAAFDLSPGAVGFGVGLVYATYQLWMNRMAA